MRCFSILAFALALAGCGGGAGGGGNGTGLELAGDITNPTLIIATTPNPVLVGEAVTVTFTISEEITGLSSGTVQITNGMATAFTQTDVSHYNMTVQASATPGTLTITVPADIITDTSGNRLATSTTETVTISPPDAPWASSQGVDGIGAWADLTIIGNGETAVQRFRWIPAGSFTMGSPVDEPWHNLYTIETQHQVTISRGFWMADAECTQRIWKAVMNTTPSLYSMGGLDLPVEQVSWDDIEGPNGFLSSLKTLMPHFPGALPTEAQWEYACRAGTVTPFGINPVDNSTINCQPWSGDPFITSGAYRGVTTVVKSLDAANAWGLYHMHGNVWEWCFDGWEHDLGSSAVIDPVTNTPRFNCVVRGGGFGHTGKYCRSAIRGGRDPWWKEQTTGFRLSASGQPLVIPLPRSIQ
jgi:formylglycine-generating enzyme required for sulfatase activity